MLADNADAMKIEEFLQLNREELRHYYEEDHSSDGKENSIVLKDGKKVIVIGKTLSQFIAENNLVEINFPVTHRVLAPKNEHQ